MISSVSGSNPARMPTPAVPVNAEQQEPQHTDAGETKVSSAPASPVQCNPERARLGKMVYTLTHRGHGEMTLTRQPKDPASREVKFDLALHSPLGEESRRPQPVVVYVTEQDDDHFGQSTLGYGDLFFPREMQGKGMSYAFHRALADAGELLGVDKVAIENVVSPYLKAACSKMGMEFGGNGGSYNLPPKELKKNCDAILAQRDWSIEPEQASRTRLGPVSIAGLAEPCAGLGAQGSSGRP